MYAFALPILRSVFRRSRQGEIPRLERVLEPGVAPEPSVEKLRQITQTPNNGYLPLTWPFIAGFKGHLANLTDPSFPLPLAGIVHVKNEILQKRPIGAGETLEIICRTEQDLPHPKGIAFSLITEVKAHDEPTWLSRTSVLYRQKRSSPPLRPPFDIPFDGIGAQNRVWDIPVHVARQYALLSGDMNPTHLSRWAAAAFGFDGMIIHGQWILARIAAEHEELLRQENLKFACQFKRPIFLPAQVVYRFWHEKDVIHFRVLNPQSPTIFAYGTIAAAAS